MATKKKDDCVYCDDCCIEIETPGLCDNCKEAYAFDLEPVGEDVKEGEE